LCVCLCGFLFAAAAAPGNRDGKCLVVGRSRFDVRYFRTVVSESTKQSLLELLCYYNGDDALPEDLIEERWFRQGTRARERQRKTWKDNGVAETVFRSIEPSTSAAYCALLQGMTRHYQVDRAWQLFEEMNHKGIPLTTEAYNSLIRVTSYLREGVEQRWRLVEVPSYAYFINKYFYFVFMNE
ncbi:unnamed protein product, partial [Timema podura]|nr:unnamed protein product [Timema podura]